MPGQDMFTTSSEGGITPSSVIAVGAVLPGLAAIAVTLRFMARRYKVASLGVDDAFIVIALVLTLALGIMMIVGGAKHGLAQPTPEGNAPKAYLTTTNDAEILTEKVYPAVAFLLDSLLILFRSSGRLTSSNALPLAPSSCPFSSSIAVYSAARLSGLLSIAMIIIVSIWSLGFFFAILFRCGTQFWALWAPLIYLTENCYNSTPMFLAFTISDVITDVLILTIPVYWVMRLNMSLIKRFGVTGIFLLGAVAVAAGCARLAIFVKQTKNPYLNADGIGHLTTEIYWSMIEMGISVIAACLPTMRPVFAQIPVDRIRSFFASLTSHGSRDHLPVTSERTPTTSKPWSNERHAYSDEKTNDSVSVKTRS